VKIVTEFGAATTLSREVTPGTLRLNSETLRPPRGHLRSSANNQAGPVANRLDPIPILGSWLYGQQRFFISSHQITPAARSWLLDGQPFKTDKGGFYPIIWSTLLYNAGLMPL